MTSLFSIAIPFNSLLWLLMLKRSILFIFISAVVCSYGQPSDNYISISTDKTGGHLLTFINDSIIEFSTIARHMSPSMKMNYMYTATDSSIDIFIKPTVRKDNSPLPIEVLSSTHIHLTKIKGGFIDHDHSLMYVRRKDFKKDRDLVFCIDGKLYFQDMGECDGYGLLKRDAKPNAELENKLKQMEEGKYKSELIKGLDAYKRFGMEHVFGVIVFTLKE